MHDAFHAVTGRDFLDVPQLPGVSYVCLRVPTGGGKALIAAHGVGHAILVWIVDKDWTELESRLAARHSDGVDVSPLPTVPR